MTVYFFLPLMFGELIVAGVVLRKGLGLIHMIYIRMWNALLAGVVQAQQHDVKVCVMSAYMQKMPSRWRLMFYLGLKLKSRKGAIEGTRGVHTTIPPAVT